MSSLAPDSYRPDSYRNEHIDKAAVTAYEATYKRGYYAALWRTTEQAIIRGYLALMAEHGGRRYLDFATGTGRVARVAEDIFPDCTAVDISAPMLEIARGRLRHTKIICRDLEIEPLEPGFDLITAFRFFLNAEPELRHGILAVLSRMLRPGGHLLANIHVNACSPLGRIYRMANSLVRGSPRNVMSLPEFERLLAEHGFQIISTRWYGLLPRLGPIFPSAYERLVPLAETWVERLPGAVQRQCQCFVVLAQKRLTCEGPLDSFGPTTSKGR